MEGLEISSGASGAPLAEPVPIDPNDQWPKRPSGKAEKHKDGLLNEWQLFKEACPHRAFAPASGMLKLQQFRRWLPRQEWCKDVSRFQHFQTLCGRRTPGLGISNSVAGGVKKAHWLQWLDRQWPSIAVPIVAEPVVAEPVVAAPSSVVAADPHPRVDIFRAMMTKKPAVQPTVPGGKVPTPKTPKAPKRHREVAVAEGEASAKRSPGAPREKYLVGTPAGDRMAAAVQLCKQGMSAARASDIEDVAESSLRRILRGEQKLGATSGVDTILHPHLEEDLKTFLLHMFSAGHGLDWVEIRDLAQRLATRMGIKGFVASSGWVAGFKERNPELVRRRAQAMERVRAGAMNLDTVTYYFEEVLRRAYEHCEERNGEPLPPSANINMDESAIQSEPGQRYVICTRGQTEVKTFSQGKGIHDTLASVIYGNGDYEDPFYIVAGVNLNRDFTDAKGNVISEKLGARGFIAMSTKGYMTDDVWDVFVDFLIERVRRRREKLGMKEDYWFLLAMDGYGSHTMHARALRKLFLAFIICVCFPSHTSSALQALDVGLFAPMKKAFIKALAQSWRVNLSSLDKWELLVVMHEAVVASFKPPTIQNAFRVVGQAPLNLEWCSMNQHKFAISAFLRKGETTVTTDDASVVSWGTRATPKTYLYDHMVADYAPTSGRELLQMIRRLHICSLGLYSNHFFTRRSPILPTLDSFDFSQLQSVIDDNCAVRHRVLMDRAVSEVFETPALSVEQQARRRGRRNAIDELHSQAKVGRKLRNIISANVYTQHISKCLGPEPGIAPAPARRKQRAEREGRG